MPLHQGHIHAVSEPCCCPGDPIPAGFDLMRLPAELRLTIYDHVPVIHRRLPLHNVSIYCLDIDVNLLDASRQIKNEASPILHRARLQVPPTIVFHMTSAMDSQCSINTILFVRHLVNMVHEGRFYDKYHPRTHSSGHQRTPYDGLVRFRRAIAGIDIAEDKRPYPSFPITESRTMRNYYRRTIQQTRNNPTLTLRILVHMHGPSATRPLSPFDYYFWRDIMHSAPESYPNNASINFVFVVRRGQTKRLHRELRQEKVVPYWLMDETRYTVEEVDGELDASRP